MHFVGFFLILFLSLYKTYSLSGRLYSSCSKSLIDRYCGVKNKAAVLECKQRLGFERGLEIFENCYNAVSETGKLETIEEKLEKICSLNRDEFIGISNCGEYAGKIDLLKTRGKMYNIVDLCLYVQEVIEDKGCGLYTDRRLEIL
ncbi:uncharacterized protein LOC111625820 isoform X2 [Centruroides sculpturatus]|uniref:uncharacterized protein LOC111625820 isoform X2 n=1 Tax=Centruroides sculpturatus TaxID=218467 RepID=UPI000C6DADBD|nr:uncharacterized protein LOC111625820 isoform X2 [Centruroides sculpturatus]